MILIEIPIPIVIQIKSEISLPKLTGSKILRTSQGDKIVRFKTCSIPETSSHFEYKPENDLRRTTFRKCVSFEIS